MNCEMVRDRLTAWCDRQFEPPEAAAVDAHLTGLGSRRGRPQIAIALNPSRAHVVPVELTHNQLSVGVSDVWGNGSRVLKTVCIQAQNRVKLSTDPATRSSGRANSLCLKV